MTVSQYPCGKCSTEDIMEKVSVSEGSLVFLGAVSKVKPDHVVSWFQTRGENKKKQKLCYTSMLSE